MAGRFIVFEGVDGCGKSTQARRFVDWLNMTGKRAIYTRHPGATLIGAELRGLTAGREVDANTKALLFAADNSAFINQILIPHLGSDTWVIGDRNNFISSLAYQIADGCSLLQLEHIHAATCTDPPKIDALLIFSVTPEVATARRASRSQEGKDIYEDKMNRREYFSRVALAYDTMASGDPHGWLPKFVRSKPIAINGDRPEDEVFESVKIAISRMT